MSASNTVWVNDGTSFFPSAKVHEITLERGVYDLRQSPAGSLYLQKRSNEFELPTKIYGLEQDFINRVLLQFSKTKRNLGVLLNGIKGTGKTVTGKIIANQTGVPIINISTAYGGIPEFISKITFECVIFIDEYEKVFSEDDRGILLSAMDGTQQSSGKLLFILTTNEMRINSNLTDRPSRVRYVKNYDNMTKTQIFEIVDDILVDKTKRDAVITSISRLRILTIDLIMEILNECNTHNETPDDFMSVFNANRAGFKNKYTLIRKDNKEEYCKLECDRFLYSSLEENTVIFNTFTHEYLTFIKGTSQNSAIFKAVNPQLHKLRKELGGLYKDETKDSPEGEDETFIKKYNEINEKISNCVEYVDLDLIWEEEMAMHYAFAY